MKIMRMCDVKGCNALNPWKERLCSYEVDLCPAHGRELKRLFDEWCQGKVKIPEETNSKSLMLSQAWCQDKDTGGTQ